MQHVAAGRIFGIRFLLLSPAGFHLVVFRRPPTNFDEFQQKLYLRTQLIGALFLQYVLPCWRDNVAHLSLQTDFPVLDDFFFPASFFACLGFV